MAEAKIQGQEYIVIPCEMRMPFRWGAGNFVGKALEELRDNGKIYANRCPQCGRFHLPPRMVCGRCHVEMEGWEKWVEVGPKGTVLVFTVAVTPFLEPETGEMRKVPYAVATIQLDGAPASFEHFLEETDPKKLRVGMRVEAVLKPRKERTANLRDILHFRTIKEKV